MSLSFIHKSKRVKNYCVDFHSHDCNEIIIYNSCCGETVINGKKYSLSDGDIAVVNSNILHNECHFSDSRLIYFGYRSSDYVPKAETGVYHPSEFIKLSNIAEHIYHEANQQRSNYKAMVNALLVAFFVSFEREVDNKSCCAKNLEYCASYLRENCSQQINFEELASECGYSYDSFRHVFKTEFGMPPLKYVITQRLKKAYRLLSETDYSCTDISLQCGFSDSSQFSKMFKRGFGISPKQLQLKCRKSAF